MRFFFTSLISVQQFTIHSIPPERENHQAVSKRVWFKTTTESPACPAAILLYQTGQCREILDILEWVHQDHWQFTCPACTRSFYYSTTEHLFFTAYCWFLRLRLSSLLYSNGFLWAIFYVFDKNKTCISSRPSFDKGERSWAAKSVEKKPCSSSASSSISRIRGRSFLNLKDGLVALLPVGEVPRSITRPLVRKSPEEAFCLLFASC